CSRQKKKDQFSELPHSRGRSRFSSRVCNDGGKPDGEGRSFANFALHRDVPAHELAELAADGQAQSGAAVLLRRGNIRLLEGLEKFPQLLWRHADAAVGDHEVESGGWRVERRTDL